MLQKQGFHVPFPLLPDPPPLCSLSVSLPHEKNDKGKEKDNSDIKKRIMMKRSSTARIFSHLPRNIATSEESEELAVSSISSSAASPFVVVGPPPGLVQSPLANSGNPQWKGAQVPPLSGSSSRPGSPRRSISPLPLPLLPPPMPPPTSPNPSSQLLPSYIPPLPDLPPPAPPTIN